MRKWFWLILLVSGWSSAAIPFDIPKNREDLKILKDVYSQKMFHDFYGQENELQIYDYSEHFSWFKDAKIALVFTNKKSILIYIKDGKATDLHGQEGQNKIIELMQNHFQEFPKDKIDQLSLMSQIAELTIDIGVFVGTNDFFNRITTSYKSEKPQIYFWLLGNEKNSLVFKSYCKDPDLKIDSKANMWSLSHYVFNKGGGVNLIELHGNLTKFSIEDIKITEMKGFGTFSYPLV